MLQHQEVQVEVSRPRCPPGGGSSFVSVCDHSQPAPAELVLTRAPAHVPAGREAPVVPSGAQIHIRKDAIAPAAVLRRGGVPAGGARCHVCRGSAGVCLRMSSLRPRSPARAPLAAELLQALHMPAVRSTVPPRARAVHVLKACPHPCHAYVATVTRCGSDRKAELCRHAAISPAPECPTG